MSASSSQNSDASDWPQRCAPARASDATIVCPPSATDGAGKTRTIAILRKNNREAIHVRVIDLDGRTSLIDLRVFSPSARRGHEPTPKRNGICLPRVKLRGLIEALESAEVAR